MKPRKDVHAVSSKQPLQDRALLWASVLVTVTVLLLAAYQVSQDLSWSNFREVCAWTAQVLMILTVPVAAWQLYAYKRDFRVRNDREDKNKAIQLAELYAREILSKMTALAEMMRAIGVGETLEAIDFRELIRFDNQEMERLLGKKADEIRSLLKNPNPDSLMASQFLTLDDSFAGEMVAAASMGIMAQQFGLDMEKAASSVPLEFAENMRNLGKAQTVKSFYETVTNALNLLECFCMYFNQGLADESAVYQSLHQSFMRFVRLSYAYIATKNTSSSSKYYVNIIDLYRRWCERYGEQLRREDLAHEAGVFRSEPLSR